MELRPRRLAPSRAFLVSSPRSKQTSRSAPTGYSLTRAASTVASSIVASQSALATPSFLLPDRCHPRVSKELTGGGAAQDRGRWPSYRYPVYWCNHNDARCTEDLYLPARHEDGAVWILEYVDPQFSKIFLFFFQTRISCTPPSPRSHDLKICVLRSNRRGVMRLGTAAAKSQMLMGSSSFASAGSNTFVVADPKLKVLEDSTFCSNGRIICHEQGLTVEVRVAKVVPATEMDVPPGYKEVNQ